MPEYTTVRNFANVPFLLGVASLLRCLYLYGHLYIHVLLTTHMITGISNKKGTFVKEMKNNFLSLHLSLLKYLISLVSVAKAISSSQKDWSK